jgi:polar amino acid transport system substrate-binding protein
MLVAPGVLAQPWTIGVEWTDYYPIYSTQDNKYRGFSRDLLDEFAKTYQLKMDYSPLSVRRLHVDYLAGKLDFKFPDNAMWNADKKKGKNIAYSDTVLEYIDGVLVLPRNLGKGKERLKTLGHLHGFTPWDYIDDIKSGKMDTRKTGSIKHLFKMLKRGKVDGVYINVAVAKYYLANSDYGENHAKFDNALPHAVGEYQLSSMKHPEIIAQFNSFLQKKSKFISKLKRKYQLN